MELIMISSTKLKIMMTADDMEYYDLDCDTIDSNEVANRRKFREILEAARESCGFDAGGDKVFVQVFPSLAGGCEMFVTRLGSAHDEVISQTKASSKVLHPKKEYIYRYKSLGEIVKLCSVLKRLDFSEKVSAYAGEDGCSFCISVKDSPLFSEYGGSQCSPKAAYYIREHSTYYCDDAVERLAGL